MNIVFKDRPTDTNTKTPLTNDRQTLLRVFEDFHFFEKNGAQYGGLLEQGPAYGLLGWPSRFERPTPLNQIRLRTFEIKKLPLGRNRYKRFYGKNDDTKLSTTTRSTTRLANWFFFFSITTLEIFSFQSRRCHQML